jgi:hypothetical protein
MELDLMADEQYTDGKIAGWPCNASIIGDRATGYDLQTAPYTVDDGSPNHEQSLLIEACDGSFKTAAEARKFATKHGFVPDTRWGEMSK